MRVLLTIEPAEEAEIVVGLRDDGKRARVLAVIDDPDVLKVGTR